MADKKITELNPASLPLNDADIFAVVQNGETKNVAKSNLGIESDVNSVNGETGVVNLDLDDIPNGTIYVRATQTELDNIGTNATDISSIQSEQTVQDGKIQLNIDNISALQGEVDQNADDILERVLKVGDTMTGDLTIAKSNARLKISTGTNDVGSVQGIDFIDRLNTGAGADGQIGAYIYSVRDGTSARYNLEFATVHNDTTEDATVKLILHSDGDLEVIDGNVTANSFIGSGVGLEATSTTNTGAVISLNNVLGNFCNMASANVNTSFSTSNPVIGGNATVLINVATEPTITGGTKIKGSDFIPSTDMHMVVQNLGSGIQYFFLEL